METIEEEIQSDLPFESHFKTLISAVVHSYIQNREITRIYANEMSSGIEPGVLDEIKAEREKFIDFIKNLLRYGEDQGYLKPLPHKLSALAIVSLMDALCTHYLENPKATCPDEIVETAYALLSSGLFAPGTPI